MDIFKVVTGNVYITPKTDTELSLILEIISRAQEGLQFTCNQHEDGSWFITSGNGEDWSYE